MTVFADPLQLTCLIAALVAVAFWLEHRFAWAKKVGASLLIIAFGALFSNLDLVPLSSPVYDMIFGPVTSLAIVWLLFAVDLRDLRKAGPTMLAAFGVAVTATAFGALAAAFIFSDAFPEDNWRLAGVMTGTYAGGSLNFVAVGREVGLEDALYAAATAADNVLTALWFGATSLIPLWLMGIFAGRARANAPQSVADDPGLTNRKVQLVPSSLAWLLALGLGLIAAANFLGEATGWPSVLFLTTLALALAQLPMIRRLDGALELGILALNFFFVVIGIGSKLSEIWKVGPEVFYFTLVVVVGHGLILYGVGWLLRLDVATLSVASQAAVGGPSTAMALAEARGWHGLALPGIVVGLAGYAVGTYLGLLIAWVVRTVV